MGRIQFWVLSVALLLLLQTGKSSTDEEVKQSLLQFYQSLSNNKIPTDPNFGWNSSSDPCDNFWFGVSCDNRSSSSSLERVALENLDFDGIFDARAICSVPTVTVLSIQNNSIQGEVPHEIGNCRQLTHLYLDTNRLSGDLPDSLSQLNNLKRLWIFNNNLAGELPDLARISGLVGFLAQNNQLAGQIPQFDFTNFKQFNVSFNNFSGPVPDMGEFGRESILGNPRLCGKPLPNECPPSKGKSKIKSGEKVLMFLGYILLGAVILMIIALKVVSPKNDGGNVAVDAEKKKVEMDSPSKAGSGSTDYKSNVCKSDYSMASSADSGMVPSSLVVLANPANKELRFEDLLRAPAELLGRGRNGSLYKVVFDDGAILAVKRIKDWTISADDFQRRMSKINQARHPNVLTLMAYYCAKQEKLVVYEYQEKGSLFKLLHGSGSGPTLDWESRLSAVCRIAEGLAYMHKELYGEGIAHGNLKSSNIMMNKNMDPCISEYGLMVVDSQKSSAGHPSSQTSMDQTRRLPDGPFKADVYDFGVMLLEMLTGKQVQNNGFDLATWVHSVVKEEWTAEVFDKSFMVEGASEERLVNLLQVALKCIKPSPQARPNMVQVATMINTIKEDEERSLVSEICTSIIP